MKINVVEKQSLDAFTTVYKKGEKITLDYYNTKPEIPETPAENTPTTPETNTPATSQPSEISNHNKSVRLNDAKRTNH